MLETVLQTKLYIPPLRQVLVSRPRLIERLNEGLALGRKMTLISAPAGFGKTTLTSEWAGDLRLSEDQPVHRPSSFVHGTAWLSLDEGDNNPARFFSYLIAALQTRLPEVGAAALVMLQSPQPVPPQTVMTALINDIAAVSDRFILVLDDYHLIDAPEVGDALAFLLEHLPPPLHLVIVTREDPLLPLPRLRARGQMTELRGEDLRFTSAEAADFLNRVMGLDLSAENVSALETRTEGWIAGLQLAAFSLQGQEDPGQFIESFTGSHRFVLDYLIDEVLNQQPQSVQSFLLQTAVLERLTGSLCDALTGQDNGDQTLEMLERANLFIIPLDDQRHWYRYHHLFADLLRQTLRRSGLEEIPALHGRASLWYEQHGQTAAAIRHAITAQDHARVADMAEMAWPGWSPITKLHEWLSWVQVLPDELVRSRPVLCTANAQALLNAGDLEAAAARLQDAERWQEPGTGLNRPSPEMVVVDEEQYRALPISLATARTYHAQALGDVAGTVKYAQRVLDLLPEDAYLQRGQITGLLGLSYWTIGDLAAAYDTFYEGMSGMQKAGSNLGLIQGTFVLMDIKMALGQLQEAFKACQYALRLVAEAGDHVPYGPEEVYTARSRLQREWGDLAAAAEDLATARKLGDQIEILDWKHRWCAAQAGLAATLGDLDGAVDLLDEAQRLFTRTPLPDVRPVAAQRARVLITQNRLAEAGDWQRAQALSPTDDLTYLREYEHVTLARLLIAQYRIDQQAGIIQEALELLERLLEAAEAGGRMGSIIEITLLQALALGAKGSSPAALESLKRSLTLAQPEGYMRIFLDEGQPMTRLLSEAMTRGIMKDYARGLREAYEAGTKDERRKTKPTSSDQHPSSMIDPLSERELEVLGLIAAGLTNKEIAARLYLSLNTVKVHTRNIFSKLDVHHRTAAVVRARELGVLSSD